MLFQAYLSNDGLVEAVVVHHRRRRALTVTAEVKIPALCDRFVDLIGLGTRCQISMLWNRNASSFTACPPSSLLHAPCWAQRAPTD